MKKILLLYLVASLLITCKKECNTKVSFKIITTQNVARIYWESQIKPLALYYKDSTGSKWTEVLRQSDSAILTNLKSGRTYELLLRYKCNNAKYPTYAPPTFFTTLEAPKEIDISKEFKRVYSPTFKLTFDGKYFYAFDADLNKGTYNMLYKYDPLKTGAIDSFMCPTNSISIWADGEFLWLAHYDNSNQLKFSKTSKDDGTILEEIDCSISLTHPIKRTIRGLSYSQDYLYLISYSITTNDIRIDKINPKSNLPIDSKQIPGLYYSGFYAFSVKENKVYVIIQQGLKEYSVDGTYLSNTPMSNTSIPNNYTQILTTAFNELYVATSERKIVKLTY